jgi:hypothetical protein
MTRDKDFKRRVRARMEKTGESYTAARARLLAKTTAPLPGDYEKLAGMSDDTVSRATGKTWSEWAATLDEADATSMEHRAIAAYLDSRHGLGPWWAQMLAVGYERMRGLRDVGQRRGGAYRVSKTRTVSVPVSTLWKAFADRGWRARWTPGIELTIRSANEPKSMRLGLTDGTALEVRFVAKGDDKSSVTLEQGGLPDRESADRARTAWGARLDDLRSMLTRG